MHFSLFVYALIANVAHHVALRLPRTELQSSLLQTKNKQCFFDGGSKSTIELFRGNTFQNSQKLEISRDLIEQLKKLPPITRKIHVTFPYPEVVNSTSDMVKYGLRQLIDFNPDWEYHVWSDKEVDNYLKDHLAVKDWELIQDKGYAEKSDLWRMVVLFCDGGYYQDLDRLYNIPLSSLLEPETKMLLPIQAGFAQDLMCSAPGNPILQNSIQLNLARRRQGGNKADPGRVLNLGPVTYFDAVTQTLFGITANRGNQVFLDKAHDTITGVSPLIKTKKESWCHLIASEHPDCKWISRVGLYKEFGIGAWADKESSRLMNVVSSFLEDMKTK